MANVIVKTAEQRAHEEKVLASYGINPQTATKEQCECAREISRQTAEIERRITR